MATAIIVSVREANLLRQRVRTLLELRDDYLAGSGDPEAIHDLRVASRRLREVLDYMEATLPAKWKLRLMDLSRGITRCLGRARETEVNLALLMQLRENGQLDSVASEYLIHLQRLELSRYQRKALKRIRNKRFEQYRKFLTRLKGVRTLQPGGSDAMDRRMQEFASFSWGNALDDEHLHDLRIRAKKFRYAVEIEERIRLRKLGRLRNRIRKLQEVLGRIHDLFVLDQFVCEQLQEWSHPDIKLIPSALSRTHQLLLRAKTALYPQVYPLYSKVILVLPSQPQPVAPPEAAVAG